MSSLLSSNSGSAIRLCVISPRKDAYSETFVRAHVEGLPARTTVLYGGYFPVFRPDGSRLQSFPERAATFVLREIFHRRRTPFERAALRRHLRRERVDVVLAEFGQAGAEVVDVCEAAGIPLITYFRGSEIYTDANLRNYGQAYARLVRAALVVAVSRDIEHRLAALGAPADRLVYNPCGADTVLFAGADPGKSPPLFLAVGRFIDKKAPLLTVLAFAQVRARCPEARLVMIGDGPLLEACRQLVRALRLGEAVTFAGVRPHDEVAAAMRGARAFVQHSMRTAAGDSEGTPLTVLEAGAAGLAVVSTRHAGIRDAVIEDETGFLVDEGDVDGMARHLSALAQDPELAARLGRRAREHVSAHFSLEKSLSTLWSVIERVTARR